jgi:hypothetical protein
MLSSPIIGNAQTETNQKSFGLRFNVCLPSDEFKDNIGEAAWGLGANGFFQVSKSKFYMGIDLDFISIGHEDYTFSHYITPGFYETFEVRSNSNLTTLNFTTRYKFIKGKAYNPYIEGIVGGQFLNASSELFVFNSVYDAWETVDVNQQNNDLTINYGAGLGIEFAPFNNKNTFVDFRFAYLRGGKVSYYVKSDNAIALDPTGDPFNDFFTKKESQTNFAMISLGLNFKI